LIVGLAAAAAFAQPPEAGPADDRASAFTAGAGDPSESFGEMEGPIWLGLGALAVVAVFFLMHLSHRRHRGCRSGFEAIEAELKIGRKPDV